MTGARSPLIPPIFLVLLLVLAVSPALAYSQFTHAELVDLLWGDTIQPLLQQRYPGASEAQLTQAHAYAYGGCLIQDVGYYPFGNRFFSDLAHYVRTGDFVSSMLREARTMDELAFAIGALTHYVGDSIGHSEAINPATGITFPDLARKYGPIVTYEESHTAHFRTEFGFDVAQSAWKMYAPRTYRKHIGFRVARPLLYRAFRDTYGIPPRGILGPARTALPSYRWSIRSLLPAFLHAQIVLLRSSLPVPDDGAARRTLSLEIARSDYAAAGNSVYDDPGFGAHVLAGVITIIPKIGPVKAVATKPPSTQTQVLFEKSLDHAITECRQLLTRFAQESGGTFQLTDLDLDTGQPTMPGESTLADQTHAKLLLKVAGHGLAVSDDLRVILIKYFSDPNQQTATDALPGGPEKLSKALAALRSFAP